MKLAEIQEMPIEQLRDDNTFKAIMSEIVTQFGDDKEDARESAESEQTTK